MSRYLSSQAISAASQRLIASRALSGFVDFLVLKRALVKSSSDSIELSMKNENFTGAINELAGTYPPGMAIALPAKARPFIKVFGTADYLTAKYLSNGASVTLAGSNWRSIVRIFGNRPRSASLESGHEQHLATTIIKAGQFLPALEDAAIWYHRATDLEQALEPISDLSNLTDQLCDSFINALGLTEAELAILFQRTPHSLAGIEIGDVLQEAVADPATYLPGLESGMDPKPGAETGTGDLSGMVDAFIALSASEAVGLRVTDELLRRFAAALGSKRFLILTGLAGSGKTKLAQAFARWLTPAAGEGESDAHLVIPVGADWTGSDAILGFPDGLDTTRYVTRPALELIQRAAQRELEKIPHFLILDEMNLSHVERYFADLLSLIESGDSTALYRPEKDGDGNAVIRSEVEPMLQLPSNLFIIGTVNVDETTYMFSPKVLDRANVIEFRIERGDLIKFLAAPRTPDLKPFSRAESTFGATFVTESAKSLRIPNGVKDLYARECLLFFDLLSAHNAEFGYRVANEAARFMHFYRVLSGKDEDSVDWFDGAMDAVIVQKLLPKLHGSRTKLEGLLWALAFACGSDRGTLTPKEFLEECKKAGKAEVEKAYSPEAVAKLIKEKKIVDENTTARYPLSFEKILRMYRKLIRDQFVTFAEA